MSLFEILFITQNTVGVTMGTPNPSWVGSTPTFCAIW